MRGERKCSVYVIGREHGPVKIGIAADPRQRTSQLQVGCPFKISLLHAVEFPSREIAEEHESTVHSVYADDRLSGEWFRIDADRAAEAIECAAVTAEYFARLGGGQS